uniref:Uncharacterized protein n=1 Tax=Amphimedon queenslandica TaxID=400682 RepID=A0A1X7TU13_AMPQE
MLVKLTLLLVVQRHGGMNMKRLPYSTMNPYQKIHTRDLQLKALASLSIRTTVLLVHHQMPLSFVCRGEGVCEVKCPYCHKTDSIQEANQDSRFCLEEKDGRVELKRDHAYYYQVECQIFYTK